MGDQSSNTSREVHALELEALTRAKAMGEINEECHRAEEQAVREFAARGALQSGTFGGTIAGIHRGRAKRMVDKEIELRRATLKIAPELATDTEFDKLLELTKATVDGVLASIPEHLRRRGFQIAVDTVKPKDVVEALGLKEDARREIEMLKREHALQIFPKEERVTVGVAKDKRKVWVVHGRNLKARNAMFEFLRAIGLEPMEWGEALALTGKGTPYNGDVLDQAFAEAQAVVVLLTGDDMARLGTRYAEADDPPEETEPTPQARPNVLFEAGMAFGKYPDRTVLVQIGTARAFSNVVGRNVLYASNDLRKRQGLADRLKTAGCDVKTDHRHDWHTSGDFDGANEGPDAPTADEHADADMAAFREITARLKGKQADTHAPEVGSPDDGQAQRLVKRGLLKPGPMGGYVVARLF